MEFSVGVQQTAVNVQRNNDFMQIACETRTTRVQVKLVRPGQAAVKKGRNTMTQQDSAGQSPVPSSKG